MTAIALKKISKKFMIPQEIRDTFKEHVIRFHKRVQYRPLHALKDLNMEIDKGEFIGIIGKNGSGKSTLLKIIANIYRPSSGDMKIHGDISPFLELGVGFNGELTGRENVYLNGVILGLSNKQIDEKYKEIVDFAELHDFMEMKLKNFSSGMNMRLAFSIAAHADADIYLYDEVLAVGDIGFQAKCFDVIKKLKKSGKTIVLVTHDIDTVGKMCDKVALLDKGELVEFGQTEKVIEKYIKSFK